MSERLPRVIVIYPDGVRNRFVAGEIVAYTGDALLVALRGNEHEFSREDGRWLEGPCLNYLDGRVHNIPEVEAAIRSEGRFPAIELEEIPIRAPESLHDRVDAGEIPF